MTLRHPVWLCEYIEPAFENEYQLLGNGFLVPHRREVMSLNMCYGAIHMHPADFFPQKSPIISGSLRKCRCAYPLLETGFLVPRCREVMSLDIFIELTLEKMCMCVSVSGDWFLGAVSPVRDVPINVLRADF